VQRSKTSGQVRRGKSSGPVRRGQRARNEKRQLPCARQNPAAAEVAAGLQRALASVREGRSSGLPQERHSPERTMTRSGANYDAKRSTRIAANYAKPSESGRAAQRTRSRSAANHNAQRTNRDPQAPNPGAPAHKPTSPQAPNTPTPQPLVEKLDHNPEPAGIERQRNVHRHVESKHFQPLPQLQRARPSGQRGHDKRPTAV
jgi:hypothetical protein